MDLGNLHERVIVIVGGTTGLGLAGAQACLLAGARVVAVGRNPRSASVAETVLGERGRVLVADAVQPDTAVAAITLACEAFGRCDGLYHVAGGSGRAFGDGPLHEITDEAVVATLQLNLQSVIFSNRAAVRHFLAAEVAGSVVNVGSVLAFSPSARYFATHLYTAAKSALLGWTRSCAGYYAAQDIRFNLLAPGLVDTPMAQRAAHDPRIVQFVRTKQPLDGGRLGTPADLDAALVFLLSDASKYVTGQVLAVDGGWSVSEGQFA